MNLLTAHTPQRDPKNPNQPLVQPPGTFDPFGPIESLLCMAAILLRRAVILSHSLAEKAPKLVRADKSLNVDRAVLRALLFLPGFEFGNRSFEAILDMSRLTDIDCFLPSSLPAPFQLPLHADAVHFGQLIGADYPFPKAEQEKMAKLVHEGYLSALAAAQPTSPSNSTNTDWNNLDKEIKESNRGQVDDIATKLRWFNLGYRKRPDDVSAETAIARGRKLIEPHIESMARMEHDRWIAEKRLHGWIAGEDNSRASRIDASRIHNCIFPWDMLTADQQEKDLTPVSRIPELLSECDYEIIKL
jgi:hypothetical protein